MKYVNNNGNIVFPHPTNDNCLKAEALVHFTWQKSHEQLMVLDIQGTNNVLTDPEIATPTIRDNNDQWNFCSGNCYIHAITVFLDFHSCNNYCEMLKL